MLLRLFRTIAFTWFGVMLPAGCGGGGGGGGSAQPQPTTTVTYGPTTLSATYFQHQSGLNSSAGAPSVSVDATFGGSLPTGTVYPVIVLDKPYFSTSVEIVQSGSQSYGATLHPDVNLNPGTYTGTIRLHLFKDASYTSEYALSGGDLPYTLTVTPELAITVKIDGVVSTTIKPTSSNTAVMSINGNTIYWNPGSAPASVATLQAGQVLELESSIPVNWTGAGDLYPYGYMWPASTKTSMTFRQVVPSLPDGVPSMTGNSFIAMPVTGSQYGAGFNIDVTN